MTEEMYFGFCTILIIMWIIIFRIKNKAEKCENFVDPFTFFSIGLLVYAILGIQDKIETPTYPFFVLLLFCITTIVGYMSFSLGYILNTKEIPNLRDGGKIKFKLHNGLIKNWRIDVQDIIMLFVLFVFIAIFYETFFNMIFNFGSGISYLEYAQRSERNALSGPTALLRVYFTLMLLGYPAYRVYRTSTVTLFEVAIIFFLGTYSIASGQRTMVIYIIVAFMAFYNYRNKLIKPQKLAIIGIFMLFFLISLGSLRAKSNILDMFSMFQSSGLDYIRINSSGEFRETVQTTLDYIKAISDESMDFNYGYTYIVDLLIFIPAFLFPDRPLPWNEQYMLRFYPFAPSGTGHAGFVFNDGYISFGILGVILELYIMGMCLAKVNCFFMKRIKNPLFLYMYAILIVHSFLGVRGSFLTGIKIYILYILPFAIVSIFFRNKKINK